ncbi:MAG: hypothetical protein L0312_20155 [Acidobacteria bacterium]|nr:hypothetical protein [Acidobacteriota bacterium]
MSQVVILSEQDKRETYTHALVLLNDDADLYREADRIGKIRKRVIEHDQDEWNYQDVIDALKAKGYTIIDRYAVTEECTPAPNVRGLVTCVQCRKPLPNGGLLKSDNTARREIDQPEAFCSRTCEEIFWDENHEEGQ